MSGESVEAEVVEAGLLDYVMASAVLPTSDVIGQDVCEPQLSCRTERNRTDKT